MKEVGQQLALKFLTVPLLMSRALEMSVTTGNRPSTKYQSLCSTCHTKEGAAAEWGFWDLQSQPPPPSSPAESLFPSSWPAQSPSSAKITKFGLLLTPCRELYSLHSSFLTGEKVLGSMQRSPEGSRAKILRGPCEITECGEAAELTEAG